MCQSNAYVQTVRWEINRGGATEPELPAPRQVMLTNQVTTAQGRALIMMLMFAARSLKTISSVLVTLPRQSEMKCYEIFCICILPLEVLQVLRPRRTAYGRRMRQL